MNPAASYLEAAIPEPVRCLGLLLKPFCLGHYMTLSRFDSAFVDEKERSVTREDVIFATLVCHFSYEDFYTFIGQKDAQKQLKRWGKKVGIFSIKEKSRILLEYIRKTEDIPGFLILQNSEGEKSGGHWSQAMLLVLTGELGYTQSEALNCPLKKAFTDWLKFAENNGVLRFLNEAEQEQLERLKEEEKKTFPEEGGKDGAEN